MLSYLWRWHIKWRWQKAWWCLKLRLLWRCTTWHCQFYYTYPVWLDGKQWHDEYVHNKEPHTHEVH